MRTAAILPVKRLHRAKSRLGASVAEELRGELARAMVGDVLVVLSQTQAIERTIVVTSDGPVAATASCLGALVIQDTAEENQSAAVALGVQAAIAERFARVLCIPGDCPVLDPAELDSLLAGIAEPEAVIIPDRHGTGTNGLLLTPPNAIAPSFGPGSCERHLALAGAAGAACRIERLPSLLLDIDTGEDLDVLRERLSSEHTRAPRTRAVLGLSKGTGALSVASAG